LHLVIACSDGYPDNDAGVKKLAEELGRLNAVVVGIGMTETAKAVKTIFNTEYSRGNRVEKMEDLPIVVAKHIITEAIKLFPKKSRQDARNAIASLLEKFSR